MATQLASLGRARARAVEAAAPALLRTNAAANGHFYNASRCRWRGTLSTGMNSVFTVSSPPSRCFIIVAFPPYPPGFFPSLSLRARARFRRRLGNLAVHYSVHDELHYRLPSKQLSSAPNIIIPRSRPTAKQPQAFVAAP